MATVDVWNWQKEKVDEVDLPDTLFGQPVRRDLIYSVVRWQRARLHQGDHKVKTRAEVRGGGKKPFRQKGTGNARQGSNRSPLMPGGGVVFGPQPRSYAFSLPKKQRVLALKSALSHLYSENKLVIVDNMTSENGKTGELAQRLKGLGAGRALLVDSVEDEHFRRACRNLPKFKYFSVQGLNVYDLLKYDNAIFTKDSIEKLAGRFAG